MQTITCTVARDESVLRHALPRDVDVHQTKRGASPKLPESESLSLKPYESGSPSTRDTSVCASTSHARALVLKPAIPVLGASTSGCDHLWQDISVRAE